MTGINLKLRYSEIGQIKINSNKCKVLTCVFCNVLVCVWGEGGKFLLTFSLMRSVRFQTDIQTVLSRIEIACFFVETNQGRCKYCIYE